MLAKAGPGAAPAGIGITGAMVGAWLVDREGAALRRGILWNDHRAHSLVEEMRAAQPDLFSAIFAHSGSVMQFGCTLPVLAWLARHEPETLARAKAVLTAKDFIRLRLTGTLGTDETEAAVAPGSARSRGFAPDVTALFGLGRYANLLPPVAPSESLAGVVTAAAAAATGLPVGTPVAVGAGDTPACVIGAGIGAAGYGCDCPRHHMPERRRPARADLRAGRPWPPVHRCRAGSG